MSVHFARKHDPEKQKKCPHCEFQTGNAGCEEFREPTKIGHSFRKCRTSKFKRCHYKLTEKIDFENSNLRNLMLYSQNT